VVPLGSRWGIDAWKSEGHPVDCRWWWIPPGATPNPTPDAVGFEAEWVPDAVGEWTIRARVGYEHQATPGVTYRTWANISVTVTDGMPFADGFESGDTSKWTTAEP